MKKVMTGKAMFRKVDYFSHANEQISLHEERKEPVNAAVDSLRAIIGRA
jgi:hypothetical protein